MTSWLTCRLRALYAAAAAADVAAAGGWPHPLLGGQPGLHILHKRHLLRCKPPLISG